jgi:hypothetical protein
MTKHSSSPPLWRRLPEGPSLAAASLTLIILSTVALPTGSDSQQDPVAEAARAYHSLLDQIESDPRAGQAAAAGATPAGEAMDREPLDRSLFGPKPKPAPAPAPRKIAAPPKPPPLPELSAILIDGSVRQALVAGRVVTVDQEIGGYRVAAIEPAAVLLVREGHVYRLEMGGS